MEEFTMADDRTATLDSLREAGAPLDARAER
jgi:hypothetical protein